MSTAEVLRNMDRWAQLKRAGYEATARTAAGGMQNYARDKKRWKDQTGNARAGLKGTAYWESQNILKATISHSMSYGIYLEMAHDRKYKILEEARDSIRDNFFNGIRKIMEQ